MGLLGYPICIHTTPEVIMKLFNEDDNAKWVSNFGLWRPTVSGGRNHVTQHKVKIT